MVRGRQVRCQCQSSNQPNVLGLAIPVWGEDAPSRACGLAERNGAAVESPCGQNQRLSSEWD